MSIDAAALILTSALHAQNMWRYHRSLGDSTEQWISELSRPLQLEIKVQLFKSMLRKVHFLNSVDSVVVEELILRLEPRTSMSWEMITREGDPGDWMAFVASGMVAVLAPRDRNVQAPSESASQLAMQSPDDYLVTILRSGAHFGEPALLAQPGTHRRSCSLQSLSWVQLQVINYKSWNDITALYPAETAFCSDMIRLSATQRNLAAPENT